MDQALVRNRRRKCALQRYQQSTLLRMQRCSALDGRKRGLSDATLLDV